MILLIRSSFFVLGLAFILSSCNESSKISTQEEATNVDNSLIVFAGISSIEQVSDTTMKLNWTAHADAVSYNVDNMTSGSAVFLTTVSGQSTSSYTPTGLTPGALYKFRVRAVDSTGTSDINTATQTVTTNLAPDVPSGIALQTPSYTPALISTPTIRVSGVKNGDVIKLFTDSSCTTQVASGTATGTNIDLTTSTLAPGAYTFYANSTNTLTNASACSSATVAYVGYACPTNYIAVPFNTGVGTTTDFCVAKYEMKCVGTSCPTATPGANAVATSQPSGAPWVSIDQTNSITACSNLNAINGVSNKYYLISNPEWMTIARNLENVDTNWTNGTAGSGVLARGWMNSLNTAVAPSTDANCLYNTGANTCGATGTVDYKRTHMLSNGEVIWDLSGNVWEWVNWQVTPANKAYVAASPIATNQGWKEFKDLNTNIGAADEMKPSTWQSTFLTATGAEGIGLYAAGTNSTGGAAFRGGHWSRGINAGVFALQLLNASTLPSVNVGFRCVYRP